MKYEVGAAAAWMDTLPSCVWVEGNPVRVRALEHVGYADLGAAEVSHRKN
jgi:hypothetical protein